MKFDKSIRVVAWNSNETICDVQCNLGLGMMSRSCRFCKQHLTANIRTLHPDDVAMIEQEIGSNKIFNHETPVRFTQDIPMPVQKDAHDLAS